MMGWRSKLLGGLEWDILTRWRGMYHWKSGTVSWVKRKHNKRLRRKAKQDLRDG